jgi:hypothetical protein
VVSRVTGASLGAGEARILYEDKGHGVDPTAGCGCLRCGCGCKIEMRKELRDDVRFGEKLRESETVIDRGGWAAVGFSKEMRHEQWFGALTRHRI